MNLETGVGLKEWASVIDALLDGRQALLIRKGGLGDKGTNFALEASTFFLYPSYLHQQANFVKEEYTKRFKELEPPQSGTVVFKGCGVTRDVIPVSDIEALSRLDGFHIWNRRFIEQRLEWRPDNPAIVVLVRVYRLNVPIVMAEQRRYRGCRSWVQLVDPLSSVAGTPVLSTEEFDRYRLAVREAIAGTVTTL